MVPHLQTLKEEEKNSLLEAPVLIAALISGTDNELDKQEIDEAIYLAQFHKKRSREILRDYYNAVGNNFNFKLKSVISNLPEQSEKRKNILIDQLSGLNSILPKLDKKYAVQLYASFRNFAKMVAEASGGFLGYGKISEEERQLIDLYMIQEPV